VEAISKRRKKTGQNPIFQDVYIDVC